MVESALRHAVSQALIREYGPNWHLDSRFLDKGLLDAGRAAVNNAIKMTHSNLTNEDREKYYEIDPYWERSRVVSNLTIGFWSNLFRKKQNKFWKKHGSAVFPGLEEGEYPEKIATHARKATRFRNTAYHKNPILQLNIGAKYAELIEFTKLLRGSGSEDIIRLIRYFTHIDDIMHSKPGGSRR